MIRRVESGWSRVEERRNGHRRRRSTVFGLARQQRNDFELHTSSTTSPKPSISSTKTTFQPHNHHTQEPHQLTLKIYTPHTVKMGWLPWSSGDNKASPKASDGGRIAPDRSSRARCWDGRDKFFACLDRNEILDAIKDDKEARRKCAKEVEEFEAACSQTWVCLIPLTSSCLVISVLFP